MKIRKFISGYISQRPYLLVALALLAIFLPLALLLTLKPRQSQAAWFDDNFAYRQTISVTNNGSSQTNYQAQAVVGTGTLIANGKLQSDCDDLRFTNAGGKLLNYWNEYCFSSSGQNSSFWVLFDSLPAGSSTIYVYYGNPSASAVSTYTSAPSGINIGTGNDGSVTFSSDTNINTANTIAGRSCADGGDAVNYSVTENRSSGTNQIVLSSTPASGCLAAGDEILIINLQGTSGDNSNVGQYEFARINSIATATLNLNHTLTNSYDGTTQKIMVQRVPNYNATTVSTSGTDLTPSAWNGTKGGVLAFRSYGTVSIASGTTINANSAGYRGGSGGAAGANGGNNGESYEGSNGAGGSGASGGETNGGGRAANGANTSPNNGAARGGGGGGGSDGSTNTNGGGGGGGGGAYGGGGGGGAGNADASGTGGTGGDGGSTDVAAGGGGGGCGSTTTTPGNGGNAGSAGGTSVCSVSAPGGEVGSGTTGGSGGAGTASGNHSGAGGGGGGYYGAGSLSTLFPGSGGGGGGGGVSTSVAGKDGSVAGGIVYIGATTVTVSGGVTSNGGDGTIATTAGGSGGAGSGGSVLITASTATLGSSLVTATGGAKAGTGTQISGSGAGGVGRIAANYSSSSGSTNPSATTSTLPISGAPASEEKGPGPILLLRMDEGYGTSTSDSSSSNTDGSISGSTWQTEDLCANGKCLIFDGSDDEVTVTNANSIDFDTGLVSGVTFSGWVRVNSDGEGDVGRIVDKGTNTYMRVASEGSDGLADLEAKLDLGTTDATATVTNGITLNRWHHVVMAYTDDGDDEITVYIDGVSRATSTDGSGAPATTDTNNLILGGDSSTTGNFHGFIDEFKVYHYERTAAQVRGDFAGLGAPESVAQAFSPNQKYLSDGLAGYWKADETSGNMADSSGNATTLTDTNTVTFSAGKFANGGDFESGSSEYQFAADNAYLSVTSSLTISAWIKPESVTASTSFDIAGKWDGANESYLLEQFGDEIRLSVDSSSNYATTDAANLATGTFYHVVGVYDSTSATVRLYVNGVLSASTVTGTIPSSIGDDAGRFHIGAEDSTTTAANFYDGFIDDIRVYNRALSKFDVESLSNWAPGPVGYWKMDENTGTSANDSSTSGNGGTTTGETWVPGKYGSSLSFNATTSRYVTLPSSSVYNSSLQSVSLWVYLNRQVANTGGTEFWTFVTTAPSDESKGWAIQYWDNNVACGGNKCLSGRKWTPEVTPTVTYTIPVQTWTHLEATWDGTNVYMYVNGVLISTTSSAAPTTGASAGCIGGDSRSANCGAQNPDALIDDVKVYNYTRTSKQVVEDMNAGHPTGGSPVGSQVIYYKFDEQQGTTINNSIASQSFTETVTGTTWKVAGSSNCKINGCLDFDGTDDVVTVTNADAIDLNVGLAAGFTISSWIYADTDGEGDVGQIWQKGTTSYCRVDSQVGSNLDVECSLDLATTDATLNISAPITTAAWNHIAVTWSDDADDEITIWINGYNRGSSTNGDGAPAADTNNLLIGGTTTANFDGKIDEFRVYSAELSASEILIDANAGSASAMGGVLGTQDSEGSGGNPPIAWWKIDENTGTSIADTSGNGNTVTASGATWTSGKVGQALSFDGSNDYMNTSSTISFGVKVITLTFWLKWDAFADDNKLAFELSTNYNNNDGSIIVNPDNSSNPSTFNLSIQDSVTTSKYRQENFTRPSAGEWHHYAAVFDNSTVTGDIKLYLDGVEQSSTLATNDKDQSSNIRTDTLYFMSRAGTSLFGAGDLDDVKIYDYERTAAQIAYDYNRGGPLAWWKFDECQGNAAYSSGSLNLSGGIITPGTAGNTTVGTCSSGTTTEMWDDGTTGKLNSAIGTDGSDDYVSVTDTANLRFDDSTADFSLFAWVKRTTTGTEYIISKEDADNDGWRLQFNSSNQVLCSEDATDVTGSLAISDTNWHHIGCTIDRDGNGQVYVDGRADGTATSISADAMATTSNVVIATRSYTPTSYFSGLIDDVRLYNYVLTADQVKRVMLGSDHGSAQRFGPDTGSP